MKGLDEASQAQSAVSRGFYAVFTKQFLGFADVVVFHTPARTLCFFDGLDESLASMGALVDDRVGKRCARLALFSGKCLGDGRYACGLDDMYFGKSRTCPL